MASGLLLSACGSSSSSKSKGSQNAASKVEVSGVAAKGLLQGAKVELCTNTECSGEENPVAVATTDNKGKYTAPVAISSNQVLVVKVSHQNGAKMICDVPAGCDGTDFGKPIDMPVNLSLRSMAAVEPSAKTVSASVTPLTELATVAAQKSLGGYGALTADAVQNGSDAIRTLFGLGDGQAITEITPVDVTKDSAEGDAALVSLLAAAFADGDIADNINAFSQAIEEEAISTAQLNSLSGKAKNIAEKSKALASAVSALDEASNKALEDCVNNCEIKIESSELPSGAENRLSNNVKAVKGLVADVRTLGWEIYPDLKGALLDEDDNYVEGSIMQRVDSVSDIFSEEFSLAASGVAEVSNLMAIAIVHKNNINNEFDIGNNPTLASIAKQVFKKDNQWRVENYSYEREYCENTEYPSEWRDQYCDNYVWSPVKLEEKAGEYAAQYEGSITTSNSNKTWVVTNARYRQDGKSTKIDSLEVTLPFIANSSTIKNLSAVVKGKASYADTIINLSSADLSIALDKDLHLETKDGRTQAKPSGIMPYVDTVSLTAKADVQYKVGNKISTFTGDFDIQGGTNTNLRKNNGLSNKVSDEIFAILPKKATVKGTFTDSVTGSELEAKVTASLDNYDSYWYHAAGTESDVPVSTKLINNNTLQVKIGKDNAENRLSYNIVHSVKEWIEKRWVEGYDNCLNWVEEEYDYGDGEVYTDIWCEAYEWVEVYEDVPQVASVLSVDNCKAVGEARCPQIWWSNEYYDEESGEYIELGGISQSEYIYDEEHYNGYYQYLSYNNVSDALSSLKGHHDTDYSEYDDYYYPWEWTWEYYQLFGQASVSDTEGGYISLADDGNTVHVNQLPYTFNAKRTDNVLLDTADNFAKATITAELTAKISNDLPVMDIKAVVKRHEFDQARADLTLGWKKPSEARRSITISAQALGRTAEQIEQSVQYFVSDEKGTQFTLDFAEDDDNAKRKFHSSRIIKDGTSYATITRERDNVYVVTYHYNDKGEKEESKSQQFETLF